MPLSEEHTSGSAPLQSPPSQKLKVPAAPGPPLLRAGPDLRLPGAQVLREG